LPEGRHLFYAEWLICHDAIEIALLNARLGFTFLDIPGMPYADLATLDDNTTVIEDELHFA